MAEKIVKDSQCLVNDLANDCISRKAAIDAIGERPMVWNGNDYELGARNQYDADVLALETVPSAQPETADCIYCHEDSDGYVKPIEKNCHAFIRFGMNGWEISLSAKGWNGSAKIRYCPMCGRDLFVK